MAVRQLSGPPPLTRLFARAVLTARGRGGVLPDLVVRRDGVAVDREHLLAYQRCCGFGGGDVLPHTYPHLLGFPLQVALMVDRAFPLPLPGLVHLENTVTVHRRLTADDRLDLAVRAEGLREHPKGRVVDLVTEVAAEGERVWESRSVYLRRGDARPDAEARPTAPEVPERPPSVLVRVTEGQGRAYAAVSGDVNPIHLHPLTARALGFPRAIAHGMWTYARALAVLGPATAQSSASQVWFQRPVFLPSAVELVVDDRHDPAVVLMRSAKEASTHHLVLTFSTV